MISTKGRYALVAMVDIAINSKVDGVVSIKDISYEKPSNASFDKFFSEKIKNQKKPNLEKLFEEEYKVKIVINERV